MPPPKSPALKRGAARNARKPKNADHRVGLIVRNELSAVDFAVDQQQPSHIDLAAQKALTDEDEVVVPIACLAGKKELVGEFIHGARGRQHGRRRWRLL